MCQLEKSPYGLEQSPRKWNRRFDKFMECIGFKRSNFHHCVYFRFPLENSLIIFLLYMDDILIESNPVEELMRVKVILN